jgi:hypothetical protein
MTAARTAASLLQKKSAARAALFVLANLLVDYQ